HATRIADANTDGVPDRPPVGTRRAKPTTDFDDRLRPYATHTFTVNQGDGTIPASNNQLTVNLWYDRRGNVLKHAEPGGLVSKTQFDGAARVAKTYVSDGSGDSTWSDARNVDDDFVLSQTEATYDANSNPILVTTRQRFHDQSPQTGALGDPGSAPPTPRARVSYVAGYYDSADRLTDTVDVGTNGGTVDTRPAMPPARSDIELVTSYGYRADEVQTV